MDWFRSELLSFTLLFLSECRDLCRRIPLATMMRHRPSQRQQIPMPPCYVSIASAIARSSWNPGCRVETQSVFLARGGNCEVGTKSRAVTRHETPSRSSQEGKRIWQGRRCILCIKSRQDDVVPEEAKVIRGTRTME
ncbi:hypothetical protein BCR44DRAFT_1438166 [Catenaria anguillulae PL171]|uniref:Secreted protein n=1 Tax=Catenaria anguillulae PL171 TaxID=765915 RepID=A0A1Y2HKA5_9FUNG|nr:hypothetical protein BCR44DRAFT_1438166 [Catenaria anguillulae PL171]